MACGHHKQRTVGDEWHCVKCGAVVPRTRGEEFQGVPTFFVPGDWLDTPKEERLRSSQHDPRLSGAEVDKKYYQQAEALREKKRKGELERPEGARLAAHIPPELYFRDLKRDRHCWKDPKHRRKYKEFLVDD